MRSAAETRELNAEQLQDIAFISPYQLTTGKSKFSNRQIDLLFRCPITKKIMNDPVILNLLWQDNGVEVIGSYTYEREAIIGAMIQLSKQESIELPIVVNEKTVRIKNQQIQQIMQTDYNWEILTDAIRHNHALVIRDTIYWSKNDGHYYIRDRSGILQCDKVADELICKIKQGAPFDTELKSSILLDIARKGYTMLLVTNTSKKLVISAFLKNHPRYCLEVPLPRMWQDKLCYLICNKSINNVDNQISSIECYLQKDQRLLTTQLHYTVHDIQSFNYTEYTRQGSTEAFDGEFSDYTFISSYEESRESQESDTSTWQYSTTELWDRNAASSVRNTSYEENRASQEACDALQFDCSAFYLACLFGSTKIAQFLLEKLKKQDSIETLIEELNYLLAVTSTNSVVLCFPYADAALKETLDINNSSQDDFILWLRLGARLNNLMHDLSTAGNSNVKWLLELDSLTKIRGIKNLWGAPEQLLTAQNDDGDTPLHVATRNQHVDLVELFLSYEANIDQQNNSGDTPLHVAVQTKNVGLLKTLCRYFTVDSIKIQNKLKQTPIYLASTTKQVAILGLLVGDKFNNMLPLHLAIEYSDITLLEFWLAQGSPIEVRNQQQQTPLYFAVIKAMEYNNNIQTIAILLDRGANLGATAGKLQQTVLHLIAQDTSVFSTTLFPRLLESIAEINQKNWLIINQPDLDGNTALHIAAMHGRESIVNMLLRMGASYSVLNNAGKSPNEVACSTNAREINKAIVLEAKQRSNRTMLLYNYGTRFATTTTQIVRNINLRSKLLANGNFVIFSNMLQIINPDDARDGIYLHDHNLRPQCIISLSNNNLASVDNEYQIHIWLLLQDAVWGMQKNLTATLSGHRAIITYIQEVANNYLISRDEAGVIKIWDLSNYSNLYSIQKTEQKFQCFAFYLEEGKQYLICGSQDGSIYIWQLDNGISYKLNTNTEYAVQCLKIVDNKLLIAGFYNGSMQIFNLKNKKIIYSKQQHNAEIYCINSYNIGQNEVAIMSGSADGIINVNKLNVLATETLELEYLNTWQDNQEQQFCLFDRDENNLVIVTKTETGCTTKSTNLQTLMLERAAEQNQTSSCCVM